MYKFECNKCTKKFKSSSGCYKHEKRNTCDSNNDKKYNCHLCSNKFKYKSGLSRHINKICRVVKDRKIELIELELVKEQMNIIQQNYYNLEKKMEEKDKKMEEKDNQIKELKQSKNIQNINNIHDNININLSINPHGCENIDKIDFKKIIQSIRVALKDKNNSEIIPNMVKNVMEIDENKNVYIPNIRANYGLILEDKWIIKDMEDILNNILMDNLERLDTFVDTRKETIIKDIGIFNYEQLKYNLGLYFNKIDNNKKEYDPNEKIECKKKIKDILISNRHLVNAFYEEITGEKIKLPK